MIELQQGKIITRIGESSLPTHTEERARTCTFALSHVNLLWRNQPRNSYNLRLLMRKQGTVVPTPEASSLRHIDSSNDTSRRGPSLPDPKGLNTPVHPV